MARPAYTEEERSEIREKILDTARRIAMREGFEAISMRKLAEQVGCTPVKLYYYFRNKRDLLRNIWEDIFARVMEACEESFSQYAQPSEQLRAFGKCYVRYWLDHPDEYRVIFMNEDQLSDVNDVYFVDNSQSIDRFSQLQEIVAAGIGLGVFLNGDAELVSQQFNCMLHGVAHMLITVPEYPWIDADLILDGSVDTFIRGIRRS